MMTIKVYRVRPDGTTDTIRAKRKVPPADAVPATHLYEPCSCPRCRKRVTR